MIGLIENFQVLEKKGFGRRRIRWIMRCLDTAHFSIMLNGVSKGFFGSSCGLKQGDPLSPFLFTLVANALSALMNKAMEVSLIEGFHVEGMRFLYLTYSLWMAPLSSLKRRRNKCETSSILCVFLKLYRVSKRILLNLVWLVLVLRTLFFSLALIVLGEKLKIGL